MKNKARINKHKLLGKLSSILMMLLFMVSLVVNDGCDPRRNTVVVTGSSSSKAVLYVQKAPPSPKVEVRPKEPTSRAVWLPAHWKWKGNKYIWVYGHRGNNPCG